MRGKRDSIMVSSMSVGIREAKARLSQLLKVVQKGNEILLTERGRPVGKIVPISKEALPLAARMKELEEAGVVEPASARPRQNLPPPIPVREELAQRLLREDRESSHGDRN
jgi:prevent-host-death family protein